MINRINHTYTVCTGYKVFSENLQFGNQFDVQYSVNMTI